MYSLNIIKSPGRQPGYADRKLNFIMISALTGTEPGVVIYRGNRAVGIQKLFPHHTFVINVPNSTIWEHLSGDNIYLFMDIFDRDLYDFVRPSITVSKIAPEQSYDFKYNIVYPPRLSGSRFYCISNISGAGGSFTKVDLEIFHRLRRVKHTLGFPGLKKRCRCWDCWAELEILKKYIDSTSCVYKVRSKHFCIITALKWIKKKFPMEREFCI